MHQNTITEGMLALERVLQREQMLKRLVLVVVACLFLGLLAAAYWGQERFAALFLGLSLFPLALFFLLMRDVYQDSNIQNHPLVRLLEDHPELFVWIYPIEVTFMPAGIFFRRGIVLVFRLTDGNSLQLRGKEKDMILVEMALQELLPNTTFGFTKEREQWYMANPHLLWKDDEI